MVSSLYVFIRGWFHVKHKHEEEKMLFDSHAHLDSSKFDNDRDLVINRTKSNDVTLMVNPGADFESSVNAVKLAEEHDFIYAAVGIHPHEASSMDDGMLELLKAMTYKKKVVAIGEIGLDYYYDNSPGDIQQEWFRKQIRMAKEVKLPVIIHDRDANQDVFDILKEEEAYETGVLLHCYSGSAELATEYVKLGAYISIAGPVTFKNSRKSHEVVKAVPLERLVIETDSPYLTPEPFRGKRNEPQYVKYVCDKIAELKGLTYNEVANATMENAKRFFNIK